MNNDPDVQYMYYDNPVYKDNLCLFAVCSMYCRVVFCKAK